MTSPGLLILALVVAIAVILFCIIDCLLFMSRLQLMIIRII